MTKTLHRISILIYLIVIICSLLLLLYFGSSYYRLPIEDRYYHPDYELLHPSGLLGHGLGIVGSLLIVIGLFSYMARKRMRIFAEWGRLKYWLEVHIFMCTWGSVLVLFHTSFKFGGIISVGFWALVIVWVSGVVGRFIYLQIPHNVGGRELSLNELQDQKTELDVEFENKYKIGFAEIRSLKASEIRQKIKSTNIPKHEYVKIAKLIRKYKYLASKENRLDKMKTLFRYWHVAHLPFALIMLIIMVIHVSVVLFFGYKWIF